MPMLVPKRHSWPSCRTGLRTLVDDLAGELVEAIHACVRVADDDEFVAARSGDEVALAQVTRWIVSAIWISIASPAE